MIDVKKLEEELRALPEAPIVLIETSAERSFEASMASIKCLADTHDKGIIVSASRPYINLISNYKKNAIDTNKMFILDCISKKHTEEADGHSVMFLENASALTDISVSLGERMQMTDGKKFILMDSINTMLIHNQPHIFVRFMHDILTKMRLHKTGGLLISLDDTMNKDVRAEIAQLCDKVIKV
ncbi:MAG: hypothetical protein JW771_02800 [Candidatus Thermoplasmatota archaeon]|nr:hypothetical protein [Candidatus Thermoplasmatota archaeon]